MEIGKFDAYRNYVVGACRVTPKGLFYVCPWCWTKYKKNGQPYPNAKRLIHTHGNAYKTMDNHDAGDRFLHCNDHIFERRPKGCTGVRILVTDETERCNDGPISERKKNMYRNKFNLFMPVEEFD